MDVSEALDTLFSLLPLDRSVVCPCCRCAAAAAVRSTGGKKIHPRWRGKQVANGAANAPASEMSAAAADGVGVSDS